MYKTIRHGENSLQYTILPQNDDFRTNPIDAEQMNAYRRNGSNSTRTSNSNRNCIKRKNKSSLLAYIGLFFVCSVVTGAILVPLLVTTDLMPSPASWFFKAQKARELRNPANIKLSPIDRMDTQNSNSNSISSNVSTTAALNNNNLSDINKVTNANDVNVLYSTSINMSYNLKNSTNSSTLGNETPSSLLLVPMNGSTSESSSTFSNNNNNNNSNDIYITLNNTNNNNTNSSNITSENSATLSTPITNTSTTIQKITTTGTTHVPSTITTLLPPSSSSSSTMSIQGTVTIVNILKANDLIGGTPITTSTAAATQNINNPNKPKILYQEITSRKNTSSNQTTDYVAKIHLTPSETSKNSDTKNWIRTHWPFIDPSTYFQWAGYDSEDSIILPAILCAALVVIFLLLTLCVIARNRKSFFNSICMRKRSRNDSFGRAVANDVQGADDNTTLLVNENASEEE